MGHRHAHGPWAAATSRTSARCSAARPGAARRIRPRARRPPRARGRGGPWGRGVGGGRARKGNVRAAILVLLAEEPRNGYQIIQEINERSGGAWKPSPGAVYPALQQLADEGLIAGDEAGGRRTFHLTDEGRAHVEENADRLAEPWAEMTPDFGEGVPELFKQAAQTGPR